VTKKQRKEQIQKKWGLTVDAQIPMVLVSAVDDDIERILEEILDGIAAIGIQLVVVDVVNGEDDDVCSKWKGKHPESIKCISAQETDSDVFDIAIMREVKDDDLEKLKRYSIVPVAEKGKVSSFNPVEEKGNGFLFDSNPWSLFASLVRAAETYRFPYDWKNIVKAVQKTV